jgi:hypothetical protein
VPRVMPSFSRTQLLRCAALTAAVAASLGTAAQPASAARPPAVTPVRAWQVLAPGWTKSNKELGRVDDIVRVGRWVYLGGNFTVVGNHGGGHKTRMYLAAERAGTGKLRGGFHPKLNGRVYGLAVSPNHRFLYVGGQFSSVGGHPRHGLAAFDLRTGRLAPRIPDLGITGTVRAVTVSRAGRIFIGGSFGRVGERPRGNLAKLVMRDGRFRVSTRWHPTANHEVRDIVVSARTSRVIIGGLFTSVNGRSGQDKIAALGQAHGRVVPWASHPHSDILDLALCGTRLYAAEGGPGGTSLAYGLKGHLKWYYMTDGNIQATTCVGRRPVFGMHGDYVAPRKNANLIEHGHGKRVERHKLFMLSFQGNLMPWNPDVNSNAGVLGVWALAAGRGNLYVGGDFTGIHGVAQQRFAILHHR